MAHSRRGTIIPAILITGITYTYWQYTQYVIYAAILFVAANLVWKITIYIRERVRSFALKDVDTMEGLSFEQYIADVLRQQGYRNVSLTEQYDYGVDIVANKDGIRWGIQVKRYSGLVKAEAVRQVITGLRLYGCDRAMVITNSTFSNVAKRLAEGNDCVLIDRTGLYELTR